MSERATPFDHPWAEDLIGNIATVTVGGTPSTAVKKYWDRGDVPWMSSGDVHLKRIEDVPQRITELGLRHSNAALVDPPSVAIALAGQGKTRGTAALVLARLCTNQSVALITSDRPDVKIEYLFFDLEYRYDELRSRSAGGGRAGLTKRLIEQVPMPLPPEQEQIKIAEVLSACDKAIEQTAKLAVKQRRIKAGVSDDLLKRGIDEAGNLRSEDVHEFKDSTLGRIPSGWSVGTLLAITERTRQPILTGPFGADLGEDDFVEEGVPVLRIGNVQRGRLDLDDLVFVSPAKALELSRYAIKAGDLLFARQGATTGRNALASEDVAGWLINYHIIRVALDHDRCAPRFIEAMFDSDLVRRQVDQEKGRGTREGINTAQLKALQLKLPPVDEQRRIAAILRALDAREAVTRESLSKLRHLKAGLMHDLLTGRKRVTPLLAAPVELAVQA